MTSAITGRVFRTGRGHYELLTEAGETTVTLSGAFRHSAVHAADLPVVGDYVHFDDGVIRGLVPRRTQFSRRAAGNREEEQVLAANVDVAFLVCGLDGDFNMRRLERYLVLTAQSGAEAVIVLNKSDLVDPTALGERLGEARAVASGTPVILSSTRTEGGLDALRGLLEPERTYVLLGSSGAGKSSITNSLLGDAYLRTQAVREDDSRGRHTTSHRELVRLPGGAFLIDTPGLREIQLWASEESVDEAFEDVADFAARCRFRDCRHSGEPGCAVAAALASGALEEARWLSYAKLTGEVRRMDKATLKQIHRNMRVHYRLSGKKPG